MSTISLASGVSVPAVLHQPPSIGTIGPEAVELASLVGLDLDLWQQAALDVAMGERSPGKWSAFEFGLCVPRRNGKTYLIVARMLAGMFLLDERLQVYSAHQFKTAMDTYNTLRDIIKANPQLADKVRAMPDANGKEGVYFHGETKARLMISARGKNAVRGFGADTVYYDEAMNLPESAVSAMLPTVSRAPNGQIWYAGSAVDQDEMEYGEVFAAKRRAGHAGAPKLAWIEYAAPGTIDVYDPFNEADIQAANPSLGLHGWTMDDIENEQPREGAGMSRRGYAVERMGIGDWPEAEQTHDSEIPQRVWADLKIDPTAPSSGIVSPVAFAVDAAPNRGHATISAAGVNADGRMVVEIVADGDGMSWVLDVLIALTLTWDPIAVVIDRASAAASLIPDLILEGFDPLTTGAAEMGQACGGFYDDATAGILAHCGDPVLTDALKDSGTRKCGDAWAWDRRGARQITPLVAATLARFGFVKTYTPPKDPGPGPSRRTTGAGAVRADDLATTGF